MTTWTFGDLKTVISLFGRNGADGTEAVSPHAGTQGGGTRSATEIVALVASVFVTCVTLIASLAFSSANGWLQFVILAALATGTYVVALRPATRLLGFISDRARLREQAEVISLLLKEFDDRPGDWLWHFGQSGKVDKVSDRFAEVSGHTPGGLVGKDFLDLLRDLRGEFGLSLLLITHDLGVVAEMADHVAVMYGGRLVESGTTRDLFSGPAHPYTRGLLACLPGGSFGTRLTAIPGTVPPLGQFPSGCPFATRCPDRLPHCDQALAAVTSVGDTHSVACHLYGSTKGTSQ